MNPFVAIIILLSFIGGLLTCNWWKDSEIEILREDYAKVAAQAEEHHKREKQRIEQEHKRVSDESREKLQAVEVQYAASVAASNSLRDTLSRISSKATECSSASNGSQNTIQVLSTMLGEVEQEGRELAAEVDRAGVALEACQNAYNALRNVSE